MKRFNPYTILFNAAGVLIFVIVGGYTVSSFLAEEVYPSCSERYPKAMRFNVHNQDGRLMSPIELQAAIGRSHRNIIQNAVLMPSRRSQGAAVLAIKIEKGSGGPHQDQAPVGGIGFEWTLSALKKANSACVGYSVYFDKKFDFGNGGMLPGLFAGRPVPFKETGDLKEAAATRMVWNRNGELGVMAQVPRDSFVSGTNRWTDRFKLEPGRWHDLEKEIVLNTPGQADGEFRVWADGKLIVHETGVTWRKDKALALRGVNAEVAYGVIRGRSIAPKSTRIAVSPFVVMWK